MKGCYVVLLSAVLIDTAVSAVSAVYCRHSATAAEQLLILTVSPCCCLLFYTVLLLYSICLSWAVLNEVLLQLAIISFGRETSGHY